MLPRPSSKRAIRISFHSRERTTLAEVTFRLIRICTLLRLVGGLVVRRPCRLAVGRSVTMQRDNKFNSRHKSNASEFRNGKSVTPR